MHPFSFEMDQYNNLVIKLFFYWECKLVDYIVSFALVIFLAKNGGLLNKI